MAPRARMPAPLTQGPFTLSEARKHGLDRWHLKGTSWKSLGHGTFTLANARDTPLVRLAAARLRLPVGAAFSGLTAAWLHGLEVEACDPIEATVPAAAGISTRAGVRIRRRNLERSEVVEVRGLPATSIHRTLCDVCLRLSLTETVVLADSALHRRLTTTASLCSYATGSSGPGVRHLQRTVGFVEPATESPMESRLRMLLVLDGLPRPEVQVTIRDSSNRFVARVDLFYRAQRLAIEYDGGIHREKLAEDNRRQNRLLEAGVRLLRFTAADVYKTPDLVLSQVRNALLYTNERIQGAR